MIAALFALLSSLLFAPPQELPHAFPREGASQLIDNARVTVWDVTWAKGKPTAMHRHRYDMAGVELADATAKVRTPEGVETSAVLRAGKALFLAKGTTHSEEGTSDVGRHAILIDLKDAAVAPLPNTSGYPAAYPREGATKLIDNARVIVWDYSWTPGTPTPMHFHDKDVVVVYLGSGPLSSTTPDGVATVNAYSFGQVRFNPRNRVHSELLVSGTQRAIAIELK